MKLSQLLFLVNFLPVVAVNAATVATAKKDNNNIKNKKNRRRSNLRQRALKKKQNRRQLPSFDMSENAIVNGSLSKAKQFPFFVQGNGCGAVLVAKDVVLSAGEFAHDLLIDL